MRHPVVKTSLVLAFATSMWVILAACGHSPSEQFLGHAVVGPHDRLSEVNSGISSLALSSPTSEQLDSINRFTQLRQLHISGWTGDGRISFEPTLGLQHLDEVEVLSNRHLRDKHLAALNLQNVRSLRVNACIHVTTGLLIHIPEVNVMETLDLRECPLIDDSILNHVRRIRGLKTLRIDFTDVSMEGAERLQELLPGCAIDVVDMRLR